MPSERDVTGLIRAQRFTVVCGVMVDGGRVTQAAPILYRLRLHGLSAAQAWERLTTVGYRCQWIPEG